MQLADFQEFFGLSRPTDSATVQLHSGDKLCGLDSDKARFLSTLDCSLLTPPPYVHKESKSGNGKLEFPEAELQDILPKAGKTRPKFAFPVLLLDQSISYFTSISSEKAPVLVLYASISDDKLPYVLLPDV